MSNFATNVKLIQIISIVGLVTYLIFLQTQENTYCVIMPSVYVLSAY